MSSTIQHFSHLKHPLSLKENDVMGDDATCIMCDKSVIGSPTYSCTSHDDTVCRKFYLHRTCANLPTQIFHHTHDKHLLTLESRPNCYCRVCGHDVKFAYACDDCDFDVCIRCAEFPAQISHHKHKIHPLTLLLVPECFCNVCHCDWKFFSYSCDSCKFDVCVDCAFQQRVLHHQGHEEHTLTLMKKKAWFTCDACGDEARDSSYVCTICQFWIHESCAFSATTILNPGHHHHPLTLVYSIPDMHRCFERECNICSYLLKKHQWLYYCHKCTYFAHMKCAASDPITTVNDNDVEADCIDNEPELVQVPLDSEESLFDLIVAQCSKLQLNIQGEDTSTIPNDSHSHIIEGHWSHPNHPLERLQFYLNQNDNDDEDNNNGGRRALICDGCIQPITASNPTYYACIQCGFFLHSFCATKLPQELPAGASPFHLEHSMLRKKKIFYEVVDCGACCCSTNGFFYHCEICDIKVDIRCAFFPKRIKHKSHKHSSLVQRPLSNSMCSVSRLTTPYGVGYACDTCSFQIHIQCALYPSRMKHRFDLHDISLRQPPFFYEGVIYCEICEERVNNQWLLYHCGECDYSFHFNCLSWCDNVKLGGAIKLRINNQIHTLEFVLKKPTKIKNSPLYTCGYCGFSSSCCYGFECNGCGFLAGCDCVAQNLYSNLESNMVTLIKSLISEINTQLR